MNIISIQSAVTFGHVGNSAAVFPLQRMGHEVWPINTVQFSNHTGYGAWKGMVFPPEHLEDLVDGMAQRGVLGRCDAILSGYLGDATSGSVMLDLIERVRTLNPAALYCCDPVMGDEGRGLFVRPGIPEFFAEWAMPRANIVTPNQFELEVLTKRKLSSLAEIAEAAETLRQRGPKIVAVTSVRPPAVEPGMLGTLLATADGVWIAKTPHLELDPPPNGTGDVFAALLLGRLGAGEAPLDALEKTVSALFLLLERTKVEKSRELTLIAAQEALVNPPVRAQLTRLA